jgi:hypothetical protein
MSSVFFSFTIVSASLRSNAFSSFSVAPPDFGGVTGLAGFEVPDVPATGVDGLRGFFGGGVFPPPSSEMRPSRRTAAPKHPAMIQWTGGFFFAGGGGADSRPPGRAESRRDPLATVFAGSRFGGVGDVRFFADGMIKVGSAGPEMTGPESGRSGSLESEPAGDSTGSSTGTSTGSSTGFGGAGFGAFAATGRPALADGPAGFPPAVFRGVGTTAPHRHLITPPGGMTVTPLYPHFWHS